MFKIFKKKETDEEIRKRILSLCDDPKSKSYPTVNAQVAVNELCRHLLGDDWYIVDPINSKQVNAVIIYEIEKKYRKYRD